MPRLLKYFSYSLFLPLWWLQLLVFRNKNVWVFGAWYGKRYSDNSKHLFEYINCTNPDIKAIWITKSLTVNKYLKGQGYSSYLAYSLRGVYYCLMARYVFVSSVKKDVNELFINGAKIVQLWHGNPMKKIGMDDSYAASNGFFYQVLVKRIFSMAYEFDYDHVVSSGPSFSKILSSAFNIPHSKILETGCPRNDVFFSKEMAPINKEIREKFKDCKLIYYLPTFRSKGKKQSLLDLESYDENKFQDFLEKENMVFVTKAHFTARLQLNENSHNNRICHLPDGDLVDINHLLKDADIFITDYSSAYFDFLLTQRPIIFAPFDLEDYLSASREMYFEYKDIIAGPIVENWEDLYKELENHQDELKYKYLLAEKNDFFNKYHDNNSSKRVFESILKRCNEKVH